MNSNKRIAINSVVIFIRLCVTSIIGLFSSRYILQALGASDFGLYNVVGGIVALLNVLNTSMVTTTYRYIAFEMGKGEDGNPNKVFNTSLAIHFGFALLILIVGGLLGEWYINNYLNVDSSRLPDARFVFRMSILTTMLTTSFVPFNGLLVALEKFTITATFDIITRILAFIGVLYLLSYYGNRIRLYSVIMFSVSAIHYLLIYIYSHKRSYKIIKFRPYNDKKLYKEMFSFAGWILMGASASIGKSQGSAIIINFFFGTLVNAAYAVARQVEGYILMFSRSLNQAAVPQITKSFSSGDKHRSETLASYISKYTFIMMSLVAFPVMLEMDFLLETWLKEVPDGATTFCQLLVLSGLLGCIGEGIPALVQASNKIKVFQISLSTLSLMSLPAAFFAYRFGAPAYAILIIYCIVDVINAFVRLYLLKRVLDMDIKAFVKTSYLKILYISIPLILLYFVYDPSSFSVTGHMLGLVGLELFAITCIVLLGIDMKEKSMIIQYIIKRRKK
jgi:O-antigen/teichoic acid export membrane protein